MIMLWIKKVAIKSYTNNNMAIKSYTNNILLKITNGGIVLL